jgi:hypothetical protein
LKALDKSNVYIAFAAARKRAAMFLENRITQVKDEKTKMKQEIRVASNE